MKQFKTWSWGFIPAAVALGFVWYEFWQSGRTPPPPASTTVEVVEPETPPAAVVPTPAPSPATVTAAPPAPIPDTIDPRLLTDPPPISVSLAGATLSEVARALNAAMSTESLAVTTSGAARYTLDLKDKPFWDIFQALQDQAPFTIAENTAGLRLTTADAPGAIKHFQRHGPAILYARSISFARTSTGTAGLTLVLGTVIDPRLKVVKHAPILILNAMDENGRVQPIPDTTVAEAMPVRPGNMWTQSIAWPAPETLGRSITCHCEVRFAVDTGIPPPTLSIDDAENKVGQTFTVGDQQVRLVRFSYDGSRISVQITPAQTGTLAVNFMITDAAGKSFGNATTVASTATFAVAGAQSPFRLVLRAPNGSSRTLSYQFELSEIPVP